MNCFNNMHLLSITMHKKNKIGLLTFWDERFSRYLRMQASNTNIKQMLVNAKDQGCTNCEINGIINYG